MLENIVDSLLGIIAFLMFFGGIFFFGFLIEEQEHRHKIELEKAKQGIFDISKQSFLKKYGMQLIIVIVLSVLIIGICYIFKIPSDLPKYILEVIK